MEKIAIIGAGLMGHGIAQIFASKGHDVTLVDLDKKVFAHAYEGMRRNLTLMAENGIGSLDDIDAIISRVTTTIDMAEGVKDADFVVEAVLEKLELKQSIFKQLDALCPPETILASNTSVISITEIAAQSSGQDRIVGTHFWNPPYLIPLVEVVPGDNSSAASVDATYNLLKSVGKHPVKVKKDVPGFVANRLQHALWREAISIVDNGIADAATVDECVRYGFGLRLPVLGPMENADLVGTDLTFAIHDYILKHIESAPTPSPILRKLVDSGKLGFKSGEGFQTWTEDQVKASHENLQKHLLKVLKEMPDD